jgi:hypothetical protein
MSPQPTFGTALLGQTEKTLNAILNRQLAGTGVTEPQWVALTLAVIGGESVDRAQLVSRVTGALKIAPADANERIRELASAGLLDLSDDSTAAVTDAGREFYARTRTTVIEITDRLWGDLPPQDLETAGRVLATVLERANAELRAGAGD